MKRRDLEHILRAAGTIAEVDKIIVVGSQSILGKYPEANGVLTVSMEADVYPPEKPEMAEVIDGCIGELSPFHERFGYYAQGVGPETAILANGWQGRLIEIFNPNTNGIHGYCLAPDDLFLSKLVAFREKDQLFLGCMLQKGCVSLSLVSQLLRELPCHIDQELLSDRWGLLKKKNS